MRCVYKQFYELVLLLKDCSYEDAGVKLQDRLCHWLAEQGEEEVADWFSAWLCGPIKGGWLLGNGGYGLVANIQGMEASWRWDRNAISGGRQVRRLNTKGVMGGEKGKRGVGRFPFPSTSPTCSRASRRAPSRPTPTSR